MAVPFLKFKDEAEATQRFALGAIILITFALAALSVSGVLATATWTWISFVPILAFALCVTGAEGLAAVSLVRVLLAGTMLRKVAGSIIFVGLAWVCVQNAKNGVHFIFPDRFATSAGELAAKSDLSQGRADDIKTGQPEELGRVRNDIAEREAFLLEMTAMSPEGIMAAQNEMITRCGYTGRVDGIRNVKTESAMRACGERINHELDVLHQRENNLLGTQVAPTEGAATVDPAITAIELKAKADAAFWSAVWLEVMLWVLEGARSLGLWVFVTSITATSHNTKRELEDEIAMAELRAKLRAFDPGEKRIIPEDDGFDERVVIIKDPPEERPVQPTAEEQAKMDKEARARKGGQSEQHRRRQKKNEKKIPVTDDRQQDEMFAEQVSNGEDQDPPLDLEKEATIL